MFHIPHLKLRCRARKWDHSIKSSSEIKLYKVNCIHLAFYFNIYAPCANKFSRDLPPKLSFIWAFSFKHSISVQNCHPQCIHLAFIFTQMQLLTQTLTTKLYSLGLTSFCIQTAVKPNGQLFCKRSPSREELLLEQN